MGFLERFFKTDEENIREGWKILKSEDQIDSLIQDSYSRPVAIYKHSPRCGLSAIVKSRLEKDWDFKIEELDFYYLNIINHKSLSAKVAKELGIGHLSPQLLLLKNGQVVYHDSHSTISIAALHEHL